MKIELPIILLEGLDCTLYRSLAEAELDLEPWYVNDRLAEMYDAAGRKVRMSTDGASVRIQPSEAEPTHQEELRRRLHEVLTAVDKSPADSSTLKDLIELCEKAGLVYGR